jgi:tetratricopeptide (TPR) repeat protein
MKKYQESSDGPQAAIPLALAQRFLALEQKPGASGGAHLMERLADTLASTPGTDGRLAALLFLRAAEVEMAAGKQERAEILLRRSLALQSDNLPVLMRLRQLELARESWSGAATAYEFEARALRVAANQVNALLTASLVAERKIGDKELVSVLLRRVLEIEPTNMEAFTRLRGLLEAAADHRGVADLMAMRARGGLDPAEVIGLRLGRVEILTSLGDRDAAKADLRGLLAEHPQHVGAMSRLAGLEFDDGAFAVAAELYIRQARFEKDTPSLRDIFLRIGHIYWRRLPDAKLAVGAYERVIRFDPANREALEALSELYIRHNDPRKAAAVTEQIVESEPDRQRRLPFLLRLASLAEKAGDTRGAGALLRRAADESPRSLQAVGELARFYERTKETQGRNILLDGAISILREDFRRTPEDLTALRSIIPLLRWRGRAAGSAAAAQLLAVVSEDPTEQNDAAAWASPPHNGRRLTPLANPTFDDLSLPAGVPPGIRNVMRILGPALAKSAKPKVKRWGVGRAERIGSGVGVRAIADRLSADLGVRSFDLYLSTAHPRAMVVEPGATPAIILGSEIASLGPIATRCVSAYALRLIETHFDLLLEGGPTEMGALLVAIIKQFVPDFEHAEVPATAVQEATFRVAKALSKQLRSALAPHVAEIAVPFPLDATCTALQESAARIGLLACGDLASVLRVLFAAAGRELRLADLGSMALAPALVDFALSSPHDELVAAIEAQSGE